MLVLSCGGGQIFVRCFTELLASHGIYLYKIVTTRHFWHHVICNCVSFLAHLYSSPHNQVKKRYAHESTDMQILCVHEFISQWGVKNISTSLRGNNTFWTRLERVTHFLYYHSSPPPPHY